MKVGVLVHFNSFHIYYNQEDIH